MGAAKMKPRDSMPTTASIFLLPIFAKSPSIAAANASPSLRSVVMSLNRIPGFGKSGTSRMRAPRSAVCTGTAVESRAEKALEVRTRDGWRFDASLAGNAECRARDRARRMRFGRATRSAERLSLGLPDAAERDSAQCLRPLVVHGSDRGRLHRAVEIILESRRGRSVLRLAARRLARRGDAPGRELRAVRTRRTDTLSIHA